MSFFRKLSKGDYSLSSSDKSKLKKSSKKKSKSVKSISTESEYADIPEDSVNNYEKLRSSTLIPLASEKDTEVKQRASSMADSLTRANSMLRKMSVDGDSVANIYQELDQELDNANEEEASEDELDDDDDAFTPSSDIQVALPPPRDGCAKYAFHEIRELLNMDELMKADLKQIAKQNKLPYDPNAEFLAFSLLKSYVAA